jgi:hypothetical protein
VATPHKYAGRSIEVASVLSADRLASLCKEAADQQKLKLDAAQPGELTFSIRAALFPERRLMSIAVRLSTDGDKQVIRTRITNYRTMQSKTYLLFVIPVPTGPKKLVGIKSYEKFLHRFGELVLHSDPEADISFSA